MSFRVIDLKNDDILVAADRMRDGWWHHHRIIASCVLQSMFLRLSSTLSSLALSSGESLESSKWTRLGLVV